MVADSIPGAFRARAREMGEAPAIRTPAGNMGFAALDLASDRVAAALAGRGIVKGDRVALYCVNGPEFAVAYLGILKAGASVVPVNLLYSAAEVGYVLRDAGVRALLYHAAMADKATAARAEVDSLALGVLIGNAEAPAGDERFTDWLEREEAADAPRPAFDPEQDVAAILYTSGTTGFPKGAQLTHRNFLADAAGVREALELRSGRDVILVVLPMFHSFAATVGMLTPLLHGLSFVPVPRFDPALVVDHIQTCAATVFLGVPSMYGLFLRMGEEQVARWSGVRLCVSGGAALPVAVLQGFVERFGIPILEGDGPTECGPVTCVNPLHGPRKPGSVGLPIPGVEMSVRDDRGNTVPDGEMGEVCVRGPNVMKGYLNLPEADRESFFGDWFRTGDLGYRDMDGYFFLVDRKKDMIIVNGMNVYPRMVEEALYRHEAIAEAAVVGEPHDTHGEIPVAYVVAKDGATLDAGQVKAWCRDNLGRHELPRKVVIRDVLPKNAAGKILKRELRKDGELERGVDSR